MGGFVTGWLRAVLVGAVLVLGVGAASAQGTNGESLPLSVSGSVEVDQAVPAATLDKVKEAFEHRFEGVQVKAVRATPLPGIFEVQVDMDLLYTDADASYVMQGSLIDAKARVDLTAQHLAKLSQVAFDSLPLNLAIKQVKGNGARRIAVFEDPNCPYCKQLQRSLDSVGNVTVYTLLFPILSADSSVKARDVWCSKDKGKVWHDWMVNGKVPPQEKCNAPLDELLALGHKLDVQGTPMIVFADGSRVNGALPLEALKEKLAAVGVGVKAK
jgi:thiol:disulfide interchange protein DsbC